MSFWTIFEQWRVMSEFNNVKQSDQRRQASLSWTQVNYDYGPNQTLINPREATSIVKGSLYGEQKVTLYNKTHNFRPGNFAVYPIDQRSISTTCTSGTLTLFRIYAGKNYRSGVISGELAAWLGIPSTGSIATPVVKYPTLGENLRYGAAANASQAELEGLVLLGELKETLALYTNPLKAVSNILRKNPPNKSRKSKSPKSTSQYLTDWWLQSRMGIMPHLNDISTISKMVRSKMKRVYSPIMHSRAVSTEQSGSREMLVGTMFNVPVWGDVHTSTSTRVMACIYYNRFQNHYADMLGFDWSYIPGALWELTPYSFLVDRVINIGQWLELCRPKSDFSILGSTISFKSESVGVFHAKECCLTSGSIVRSPIDFVARTTTTKYTRETPGPLAFKPMVNIKLGGLVKTLDHLTLLNQNILSKIR